MAALEEAERARQVLRIGYRRRREVSTREIEPLGHDARYCYAYCRLRQDYRQFRLDAIESVSVITETLLRGHGRGNSDGLLEGCIPPSPNAREHTISSGQSSSPASRGNIRLVAWILGIVVVVWLARACGG